MDCKEWAKFTLVDESEKQSWVAVLSPIEYSTTGHFCPEGTGIDVPKCPSGSYSSKTMLTSQAECTLCDGGHFCDKPGSLSTSGTCREGTVVQFLRFYLTKNVSLYWEFLL